MLTTSRVFAVPESKKRVSLRKLPAILVAVGVLASLSGCSGSPFALGGCTPAYADGSNAKLVTAHGHFDADPNAKFPTPLVAKTTEEHVAVAGHGKIVAMGNTADVRATVYNGKTGASFGSAPFLIATSGPETPGYARLAQCAAVHSRVSGVGPAVDLLGADVARGLSLRDKDTVVVVVDIKDTFLGKANGADQLAQPGFPAVVLAPSGQPGLTFPDTPAPTEAKSAVLKQGSGETIAKGDRVVAHFSSFVWEQKILGKSSWPSGRPEVFNAVSAAQSPGGLPAPLADALIGQRVGSQIIVILPPAATGMPAGSTFVMVIDILGIE